MKKKHKLDFESIIPENSKLISLNQYGGEDGVIHIDLDGDKDDEIIYAYSYLDGVCIGVIKDINNEYRILDLYKGRGVRLSYVRSVYKGEKAEIVVGWTLDGKTSLLGVLRLEDGIIQNQLKEEQILFNKIDLVRIKEDKDYYIALWEEGKNKSYKVTIYEVENKKLKKSNKYNKEYYKNVIKYYKILISKLGENSFYLYNLALAQYIAEEFEEALETVNEAIRLKEEEDLPKKKDIEKLRDIIKSKN